MRLGRENGPMTTSDEVTALRAEVAAVRRQVHILLVMALLCLGVGVWSLTRGTPIGPATGEAEVRVEDMEARAFRLIDSDGNLRGLWHCPPAGPFLTLFDEKGR